LSFLTAFSLQLEEVEKSWKSKGYSIVNEGDLKLVELSFEYDNICSINTQTKELFVITYLESRSEKPGTNYIADIKRVLLNSSFSEQAVHELTQNLSIQESWVNTFRVGKSIQVESFLYDQTTPVLKITPFEEEPATKQDTETSDSNVLKELEEELNKTKAQSRETESENQHLKAENQILTNKMNVCIQQKHDLIERIGKYENLSTYRDHTISGLKNTIDRYVEIEKQKDQRIADLKMEIDQLEDKLKREMTNHEKTIREMQSEIERLELFVKKQSAEMDLLKDTEQMYLSRIEQLKKINEQKYLSPQTNGLHQKAEEQKSDQPNETNSTVEQSFETVESTTAAVINQDEIEDENSEKKKVENNKATVKTEPDTESENTNKPSPLLQTVTVYNKGKKSHSIEHDYDQKGNLIKETVLLPNGKTVAFTETTYHENGKVKEKIAYENSKMVGKTVFQYDQAGRPLRVFFYDSKSMTHYSVYEYDPAVSEEEPIKVKHYRDNKMNAHEENLFDEDGMLIKTIQKDSTGTIISTTHYEYSDDNPVKISSFRSGKHVSDQIIHYDENGVQKSIETYDAKKTLVSKVVFIWDETH